MGNDEAAWYSELVDYTFNLKLQWLFTNQEELILSACKV